MLGRTMHAISYDPVNDEIVVPQQFGQGILIFKGTASGETAPARVIRGPSTELIALDRLVVDGVNKEIYVPEGHRVLVFPQNANGDTKPIRVIEGPDTRIGAARAVAVDATRNLLIVVSTPPRTAGERGGGGFDRTGELTIFDRAANGNVKPKRVISTGRGGTWNVAVHPETGLIFVVMQGYVAVWHIDDPRDARPRMTIGGPKGPLQTPRGVTIDAKNKSVIVSDKQLNSVLTFEVPQLFDGMTTTASKGM